jgi:hypothetical protein
MSSVLTPNYPPPARKSKEENIAEASAKSQQSAYVDENGEPLVASPPPPINWAQCGLAMGVMVIIFGVIIGILVGQNKNLDTSDPPAPAPAATNSTNSTSIGGSNTTVDLGGCDLVMKDFTANDLVLTMSVSSEISALEINYASSVFEKTYTSLLKNELAAATSEYCDPYCRDITSINVTSNTLTTPEAEARQSGPNCDATLELTFSVMGTFVGCNDTVFPGLFSSGRRQLVQVQQPKLRFDVRRALEDEMDMEGTEEDMDMTAECPSCLDDESTLGFASPSLDGVKTLLSDYVTVLPAVCELTDAVIKPAERK